MGFHRRRELSEFSEITSAENFDLAFVIILLHIGLGGIVVCYVCNENDLDMCEIIVAEGFSFHCLELQSHPLSW